MKHSNLIRKWVWWAVALAGSLAAAFAALTLWPAREELSSITERRLEGIRTELTAQGLELGAPIFIRIFKESGELELWVKSGATFSLFKTFPICRWSGVLGPKLREGDGQSPEGFYRVTRFEGRGSHVAEIGTLAVRPDLQGSGLAREMIADALAALKAEGIIRVQLFVEPENARGIAFYERMGFHKEALMKRAYRRSGEATEIDDLVMVRFLDEG